MSDRARNDYTQHREARDTYRAPMTTAQGDATPCLRCTHPRTGYDKGIGHFDRGRGKCKDRECRCNAYVAPSEA